MSAAKWQNIAYFKKFLKCDFIKILTPLHCGIFDELMVFQFKCCGIVNDDDYNQSHWRKEALGGEDLIYPLTCCSLENANNFEAFLNPMVKNQDKCMSPDVRLHGQHRHTQVN